MEVLDWGWSAYRVCKQEALSRQRSDSGLQHVLLVGQRLNPFNVLFLFLSLEALMLSVCAFVFTTLWGPYFPTM